MGEVLGALCCGIVIGAVGLTALCWWILAKEHL